MTRPILPDETALIEMYENPKQKSCILTSVARQIQDAESVVYCVSKALEHHEGGSESHALLCAGDKLFNLRCDIEALNAHQEKERETDTVQVTATPSPANDENRNSSAVKLNPVSPETSLNAVLLDILQMYHSRHAQDLDDGIADLITDALRLSAKMNAEPEVQQ